MPVLFFLCVDSQMTQNILHVPLHGANLFIIPLAHSSPFNENTGNSLGSRIVISSPSGYIGFHHVRHIHLFCHSSGDSHYLLGSLACIIHIWGKFLVIISTVQINITIRQRQKLRTQSIRQPFRLRSIGISWEYPVQVLAVFHAKTSGSALKGSPAHHFDNHDCTCHLLSFQIPDKLHCRLDSHILTAMDACGNQYRLAWFLSPDHRRRQGKLSAGQLHPAIRLLPGSRLQAAEGKNILIFLIILSVHSLLTTCIYFLSKSTVIS